MQYPSTAISRKLYTFDGHGKQHELETVVHFTIAAIEGPAVAAHQQMDEAVAQGNFVYDKMRYIPSSLRQVTGAVDDSISMYNDFKPIMTLWSPFLDRVEQLTRIVDQISEV
jgi:hypothetical protein